MASELHFTRAGSAAALIERHLQECAASLDLALYRLNHPRLFGALDDAVRRGVRVRLVLDRNKYDETPATQQLLAEAQTPFRLLHGRLGPGSKMHHKFAIFDAATVITGSYNWTVESEEQNYESLLILREAQHVAAFLREFESLWADAAKL